MMTKTFKALLSRNFDSDLINSLLSKGYTLSKMKELPREKLLNLGLDNDLIETIQKESRPPIKENIVNKLLYESRRTCCICRDSNRPFIIHHIDPWSISKDNSESNLVILCLEHHDQAHTKKKLSSNLTSGQIRDAKLRWLDFVAINDKSISHVQMINLSDQAELISIFKQFALNIESPGNVQDWFTGASPESKIEWETKGTEWKEDVGFIRKGHIVIRINGKPLLKLEKYVVPAEWTITLIGARGFFHRFEIIPEIMSHQINPESIIEYFEENDFELQLLGDFNKGNLGYQKELYELIIPGKKKGYLLFKYDYGSAGCSICMKYFYKKPSNEEWIDI